MPASLPIVPIGMILLTGCVAWVDVKAKAGAKSKGAIPVWEKEAPRAPLLGATYGQPEGRGRAALGLEVAALAGPPACSGHACLLLVLAGRFKHRVRYKRLYDTH